MPRTDEAVESLSEIDAARFKQRYDWIDELAVRVNLEVASTSVALVASLTRCLATIGAEKAPRRSRLLRFLYLSDDARVPQHEISRQLGVTSPNVTYLVDSLEKDGLVTRVVNTSDRRETFIELTPKGKELSSRMVPLVGEFMGQTCSQLTEREKRQLLKLLEKFKKGAEAVRPGADE